MGVGRKVQAPALVIADIATDVRQVIVPPIADKHALRDVEDPRLNLSIIALVQDRRPAADDERGPSANAENPNLKRAINSLT